MFGTDGFLEGADTAFGQPPSQAINDFLRHGRPFVNKAGVKLHERRAGGDLLPRVVRIEDAADTNDRQRAVRLPVKMPDDFRAARAEWPTPATTARDAAATSAGSLVTTGSAPARASAEQTLRRLPAP